MRTRLSENGDEKEGGFWVRAVKNEKMQVSTKTRRTILVNVVDLLGQILNGEVLDVETLVASFSDESLLGIQDAPTMVEGVIRHVRAVAGRNLYGKRFTPRRVNL